MIVTSSCAIIIHSLKYLSLGAYRLKNPIKSAINYNKFITPLFQGSTSSEKNRKMSETGEMDTCLMHT